MNNISYLPTAVENVVADFSSQRNIDKNVIMKVSVFHSILVNQHIQQHGRSAWNLLGRSLTTAVINRRSVYSFNIPSSKWRITRELVDKMKSFNWLTGYDYKVVNNSTVVSLAFTAEGFQAVELLLGMTSNTPSYPETAKYFV